MQKKAIKKTTKTAPKDKGLTMKVGSYGTKWAADQDALEYRRPQVFQYRSAIFPDPQSHGVVPSVLKVEVVEDKANALHPFSLRLTMKVAGAPEKAARWFKAAQERADRSVL